MKKIVFEELEDTIYFVEVNECNPIFVKERGKLFGMVVLEKDGWIVRIGRDFGSYGHRNSLKELIKEGIKLFDFEFYIED